MNRCVISLSATILSLLSAGAARAEPMDPALSRLVLDPRCRTAAGAFQEDFLTASEAAAGEVAWCQADNAAFKRLINQYGFAFAPNAMHSARTTGVGGVHFSFEGSYTKIDSGADYWKRGTQGRVDTSDNTASVINESPQALLQLYSVKVRKGFGFGFEIMATVGFMPKTSILSGGADVRVSLLEGFRSGIPGALPDIAVGGGVRTITGTPEVQLTVASLDTQVSKPLPIQSSSVLTPWIGYQYVWIFGDSNLIDLTPATNALQYCNFAGVNVPGNPDPDVTDADGDPIYTGHPVCKGGSSADFNNNAVFEPARLERQRLLFGVNYQYEMIMAGTQFMTDLIAPAEAQTSDADTEVLEDEDRQWTLVFELGTMF